MYKEGEDFGYCKNNRYWNDNNFYSYYIKAV